MALHPEGRGSPKSPDAENVPCNETEDDDADAVPENGSVTGAVDARVIAPPDHPVGVVSEAELLVMPVDVIVPEPIDTL